MLVPVELHVVLKSSLIDMTSSTSGYPHDDGSSKTFLILRSHAICSSEQKSVVTFFEAGSISAQAKALRETLTNALAS